MLEIDLCINQLSYLLESKVQTLEKLVEHRIHELDPIIAEPISANNNLTVDQINELSESIVTKMDLSQRSSDDFNSNSNSKRNSSEKSCVIS